MRTATDPNQTVRRVLPYAFRLCNDGKLSITNTRGQVLFVTQSQVTNILTDPELDVHRRKMYEAALEYFEKKAVQ